MTTQCIAPEEIQEGDLVAFIEGKADQRVRDHLARCPFCAAEVAALAQADYALTRALRRGGCPTTETLIRYQSGLLSARERRQVGSHLRACSFCAQEVERLAALDDPRLSLWEEARRAARTVIEAIRAEPPATLVAAVRGSPFDPRLYRVHEFDVILGSEVSRSPQKDWCLRGRVMRAGQAATELVGCPVRLIQQDHILDIQSVNELGYFGFEHLEVGQYDVWLEQSQVDVVVRQVPVGMPGADRG